MHPGQFHFSHALPPPAGRANRLDGADPNDQPGTTSPVIYNGTYLGAGLDNTGNDQEGQAALSFTQEAAGAYINCVVADFSGFGVCINFAIGRQSFVDLLNRAT